MKQFIYSKKAQGLPLNTIVLAILVIIVLLVIVVFFTTKIGETSKSIDNNAQITTCSTSNVAIASLGYTKVSYTLSNSEGQCDTGSSKISIVPNEKDSSGQATGKVCCGIK